MLVEKFFQLDFGDEISAKYERYNLIIVKSDFWLLVKIENDFLAKNAKIFKNKKNNHKS